MIPRFLITAFIVLGSTSIPAHEAYPSGLLQGVKTSADSYAVSAPVEFTFVVRNTTDKPITYTFPSSKQFDLWITLSDREIYTLSKHRVYLQMLTSLTLQPDEVKTFTATWDQKDDKGKAVGPGTYAVSVQLTPNGDKPPAVSVKFTVDEKTPALVPLTVKEVVKRVKEFEGRRVRIDGTYRGFRPDPNDANTKNGPPVTRSDWAVCDSTGCIYVTGRAELDPENDIGKKISVTGRVKKTEKGQVYLVLDSIT
ncbi:hypothetical protein LLG46_12415 [bacterium]|nr:hypothetical protein [bacterium]